jgi:hypothetical protein
MAEPLVLKFPAGVDNRSREYAVSNDAARVLDNLDVTRDGGVISRKGLRLAVSGDCHSLFVHPSQRFSLIVIDGTLTRMDADESVTSLQAVDGHVSYALLNDEIYWTDGVVVKRITAKGELASWGLSVPPLPQVTAVADGGLPAGAYRVAMTAIDSDGLESPASEVVSVDVVSGGGLEVTTPTASGVSFAIYRTEQNGPAEMLRRALVVDPATTVTVGTGFLGSLLQGLYAAKPLPGQALVSFKGRLWAASRNVLWFTSGISPHWLFPSQGFYQFETDIQALGASEDGIYVGLRDRVYYLQGTNPFEMTQRPVSSAGATAGSMIELPYDLFLGEGSFPSRQCAFLDTDGLLCVGKPGGILVRPTRERYSAGESSQAVMAYRVYNGLRQVIMANAFENAPYRAVDVDVSEVFTNGIVLNE